MEKHLSVVNLPILVEWINSGFCNDTKLSFNFPVLVNR